MKKHILLLSLSILLLAGCDENMPVIDCLSCPSNTTTEPPEDEDRRVIIEEFTGVRCVNCPQGSDEIKNLQAIHGERLIAVSIHAGFFSTPYADNIFDFRTPEGTDIQGLLGEPLGYPSAVIDRKIFSNENELQVAQASWAGHIAEDLAIAPKVSVSLDASWNDANRQVDVTVSGAAFEDVNDELRLTVFITENSVFDVQLTPDGINNNYEHRHVLRKALSTFDGDLLTTEGLGVNEDYSKTYSYVLPDIWDETNCDIVAFIHYGGSPGEVIQANEVHIIE